MCVCVHTVSPICSCCDVNSARVGMCELFVGNDLTRSCTVDTLYLEIYQFQSGGKSPPSIKIAILAKIFFPNQLLSEVIIRF